MIKIWTHHNLRVERHIRRDSRSHPRQSHRQSNYVQCRKERIHFLLQIPPTNQTMSLQIQLLEHPKLEGLARHVGVSPVRPELGL